MPIAQDLPDLLESRKEDFKVIDQWDAARPTYREWHQEIVDVQNLYAGNWDLVWPDKVKTRALPKIPNFIQLASEDRARQVASVRPSVICRPDKAGDPSKTRAEKRERIIGGWWAMNRVMGNVQAWAHDAMSTGLTVCRVLPDFNVSKEDRFPVYTRLEPALCFPDPVFTKGPFCDSLIYSYEEHTRNVEKRYGVSLNQDMRRSQGDRKRIRVIEYYDVDKVIIVLESREYGGRRNVQTVLDVNHELDVCPTVIGARPTLDGVYRGEFFGAMGVMNFWNKMMTLTLDDAISKVYAPKTYFDIENPEEYGPDALLEKQSAQGTFEYVQPPNQPFTNIQLLHDLAGFARAGVLMPPSRSGDPNESIISAAGISATQSQFVGDVKSIQTDILAPMLEAGNEVAMRGDERWADAAKTIYGEGRGGSSYKESYTPSKDINGCYRNSVSYGNSAGLDPINANVMVLQQWAGGNGIISRREAMEQSPYVENPQRVEKELLKEGLETAMMAGLQQQANAGTFTAQQLAEIDRALDDDAVSLSEAISRVSVQAPLAPQPQVAPGGPSAPGLAGAATGGTGGTEALQQAQSILPSLRELGVRR